MTHAETRNPEVLALERKVCEAALAGVTAALKPLVPNLEAITIVVQLKSTHGRLGHCRPYMSFVKASFR